MTNHNLNKLFETYLQAKAHSLKDNERFSTITNLARTGTRFVLFGAGTAGKLIREKVEGLGGQVVHFLDNDIVKHNSVKDEIPVYHPGKLKAQDLYKYPIIIASMYGAEISSQLTTEFGMKSFEHFFCPQDYMFENNILNRGYGAEFLECYNKHENDFNRVLHLLEDERSRWAFVRYLYLRLNLLSPERLSNEMMDATEPVYANDALPEIFLRSYSQLVKKRIYEYGSPVYVGPQPGDYVIDGGAWVGDTAFYLANKIGVTGKIWSFEPSITNCNAIKKVMKEFNMIDRVTIVPLGLWSKQGSISFVDSSVWEGSRSYVSKDGGQSIPVTSIDEFVHHHSISKLNFIKLDIEGSELQALQGAEKTIIDHKPVLSISLYHQVKDLYEIPLYINKLNAGYKFYFKHVGISPVDAILYSKYS